MGASKMSLHPEVLKQFDPKDLEELYAYLPVGNTYGLDDEELMELKHSASPTDDPKASLFILKRDKHPDRLIPVSYEDRDNPNYGIGFDFLNQRALNQYENWTTHMYHSDWWGPEYSVTPLNRDSEPLANYCLAYWAHAIQVGGMSLSLSANRMKPTNSRMYHLSDGQILVNGCEHAFFSSGNAAKDLRDVVPALLGAFETPVELIPHNLDAPFPHRNVWDIPGGKMLVVPENYDDKRAGVKTIRFVPSMTVERLKAAVKSEIE